MNIRIVIFFATLFTAINTSADDFVIIDQPEIEEVNYVKPFVKLIDDIRDSIINLENPSREDFQTYIRFSDINSSLHRSCKKDDQECVVESALLVTPLLKELFIKERNSCGNEIDAQVLSLQEELGLAHNDLNLLRVELEDVNTENQRLVNQLEDAQNKIYQLEQRSTSRSVSCSCSARFLGHNKLTLGVFYGNGFTEELAMQNAVSQCWSAVKSYSSARSNQVRSGIYSYEQVECL